MKMRHALIAIALSVAATGCWQKSPEEQNKQAAELVIDKLRVHHDNTGGYPDRLDDFNFGPDKPDVDARHYNYFRKGDDDYSLQFFYTEEGKATMSCTYESADKSWSCGPG
jgi:hypothetical protein